MDKTVRDILSDLDKITVEEQIADDIFLISLLGNRFILWTPSKDELACMPLVLLYNNSEFDFPHIMLSDITIGEGETLPEGKYRFVCLYENDDSVNSIISYEDKIIDVMNRLTHLLEMSNVEIEHEFQKEFMVYWNNSSHEAIEYSVFLRNEKQFSELNIYYNRNLCRLVDRNINMSDINAWQNNKRIWTQYVDKDSYYIPITDCRGIIPPHQGYCWSSKDIRNIVYAPQIAHIDEDTFQAMKAITPRMNDIILVFGMLEVFGVFFAVRVMCSNNSKGHNLLEKIAEGIISVEPLYTKRKDYLFLNKQIGNDKGLINKKIILIGAGSLGSYIAFELVKNGATHMKIYDKESILDDNILRWAYGNFGVRYNKAELLSVMLNRMHPEVSIEFEPENIDEKTLKNEAASADIIIFTIGSSDRQLKFNRILKKEKCSAIVFYCWLESGGINSHILAVDYRSSGCFECLYTDETGNMVNNRGSKNTNNQDDAIIRNGCGGTRAAYGTAILLRTTAALLDIIHKIMDQELAPSILMDISSDSVKISDTLFPEGTCGCCGDKTKY